ncbi:MAG: DUF6776 family protein [Pseudomonadota bacterium]|nr:DUF6776 family protein [Pseudomonadota bacterium]
MSTEKTTSAVSHPFILVLMGILIAGAASLLGYNVGHQQGMTVVGASVRDVADLNAKVADQKVAIELLEKTLATMVQERDLALETAKNIQTQMQTEADLRQLSESRLTSYQDILIDNGGIDLKVRHIEIKPLPERAFEYQLDLMQLRPNRREISGRIEMHLINGETVVAVPLSDDRFKFNAFQRLAGRWTMPAGFTPKHVEIKLRGGGQNTTQRYAWEQGRNSMELPATLADLPPVPAPQSQ